MAVLPDAFAAVSSGAGFSGSNLILNNFTIAGSPLVNGCIFYVIIYSASNTTGLASTSVTYGGKALSQILSATLTNKFVIEVWRRVSPLLGTNACAVSFSGAAQNVQVFALSYSGVDQTTPVNASTSAGEAAITNATYPTSPTNISGALYGFMAGGIHYSNGADGPSTGPSPFGTTLSNNSPMKGAAFSGNLFAECFDGAYSGAASPLSLTSNDGSAYDYILAAVSINAAITTTTLTVDTAIYSYAAENDSHQVQTPVAQASYGLTGEPVAFSVDAAVAMAPYGLTLPPINQIETAMYGITTFPVSGVYPGNPYLVHVAMPFGGNNGLVMHRRRRRFR